MKIKISPIAATINSSSSFTFSAELNYPANQQIPIVQPVLWTVEPTGGLDISNIGGTITVGNMAADTVFTIKAERQDYPGTYDTAQLTVLKGILDVAPA